ncbi:hypothetical protein [Nocardia cyriacigeorgica]|uniref:hypothetical protein n=1 Tax=Nocardia cyriacigeorgica TaxID=135487 RepID=UPI002456431E|nr:hypothetical protein [Nocardia cyriacigeorgica]
MLDMEEPPEVIAAAGTFVRAIETVNGQVGSITDALVHFRNADSPLDHATDTVLDWIVEVFTASRSTSANSLLETLVQTTAGATALETADLDGATRVRRQTN